MCQPYTTSLFAGRDIDAGTVTITEDGDELVVRIESAGGNPAPGSFPYHAQLDEAAPVIELRIPMPASESRYPLGCRLCGVWRERPPELTESRVFL